MCTAFSSAYPALQVFFFFQVIDVVSRGKKKNIRQVGVKSNTACPPLSNCITFLVVGVGRHTNVPYYAYLDLANNDLVSCYD